MNEEKLIAMLKELHSVAGKLNTAYLIASTSGGDSSFGSGEYNKMHKVMSDVEEFLKDK